MEIVERMENKLLNRVEIRFSWRHSGKATPSRREVMDLVKTLEPKSNPEYIVIKDCNTRFGQPLTTGLAYICLLYTSPSPRDGLLSRMPSSA